MRTTRSVFLLCLLAGPALPQPAVWQIDTLHSGAHFSVRHMMVTTVRGQFGGLKGQAQIDDQDVTKSSVEATIDASTINSGEPKRDRDLKGPDFFDVEKFPTLSFRSTRVERAGAGRLRVTGDLTIRGVTRPVSFEVEGPTAPISDKNVLRRGASATAKINRRDFGITWNRVIETGGVAVSDEVTITLEVALVRR
jgi:polyisoprenoid-binding protein YceI